MSQTDKNKTLELEDGAENFLIGTKEGLICRAFPPLEFSMGKTGNTPNGDVERNGGDDSVVEEGNGKKKMMLKEYESLRKYLEELRNCQTQFFWSSIAASGVIVSFGAKFYRGESQEVLSNTLYFSSLATILIVCPLWCIWFLKASSITRVAGYLRVLEDIISNNNDRYKYVGWENSYFIYRRSLLKSHEILRNETTPLSRMYRNFIYEPLFSFKSIVILIWKFEKPYQYNILTWLGYFFVTAFCILIAFWSQDDKNKFLLIAPVIGLIFTIFYTAGVLFALSLNNDRSMATRERLWRYLLDNKMFEYKPRNRHFLIIEREAQSERIEAEKKLKERFVTYANNEMKKKERRM